MWPFKKKFDLFGFRSDKEANLSFDLTEEEQQEVENTFKMFEGLKVHLDVIDDVQNGATAFALSNYANEQVLMSKIESQKGSREELLLKAIAAIAKAYSIYPLPIFIYDLACFMEMVDKIEEAKNLFRDFLNKQSNYQIKQIDETILMQRDINEAIKDAQVKVKC